MRTTVDVNPICHVLEAICFWHFATPYLNLLAVLADRCETLARDLKCMQTDYVSPKIQGIFL